jgi:hypothetical protein
VLSSQDRRLQGLATLILRCQIAPNSIQTGISWLVLLYPPSTSHYSSTTRPLLCPFFPLLAHYSWPCPLSQPVTPIVLISLKKSQPHLHPATPEAAGIDSPILLALAFAWLNGVWFSNRCQPHLRLEGFRVLALPVSGFLNRAQPPLKRPHVIPPGLPRETKRVQKVDNSWTIRGQKQDKFTDKQSNQLVIGFNVTSGYIVRMQD